MVRLSQPRDLSVDRGEPFMTIDAGKHLDIFETSKRAGRKRAVEILSVSSLCHHHIVWMWVMGGTGGLALLTAPRSGPVCFHGNWQGRTCPETKVNSAPRTCVAAAMERAWKSWGLRSAVCTRRTTSRGRGSSRARELEQFA